MGKLTDLSDQKFGRLLVQTQAPSISGNSRWNVRCDCGTLKTVWGNDLKRGKVVSCGCHRDEINSARLKKHGMSQHPAYASWRSMLARCGDPTEPGYPLYGGRGITVCDRWSTFEAFWLDMAPGWRPRLSLDRIDSNGNYEPSNVRWATAKEQGRNRRDNRRIMTPDGEMTVAEAAERYGLEYQTLSSRLRYGWTDPHELVKPPMEKTEYLKQYRTT